MLCPKCNKKFSQQDIRICPDCGCELTDENVKIKTKPKHQKSNGKKVILPVIITICLIAVIITVIICISRTSKKKDDATTYEVYSDMKIFAKEESTPEVVINESNESETTEIMGSLYSTRNESGLAEARSELEQKYGAGLINKIDEAVTEVANTLYDENCSQVNDFKQKKAELEDKYTKEVVGRAIEFVESIEKP